MSDDDAEDLMRPSEVAAMFSVHPKTVTRWARAGKLGSIQTPGGHRRFHRPDVEKFHADFLAGAMNRSGQ